MWRHPEVHVALGTPPKRSSTLGLNRMIPDTRGTRNLVERISVRAMRMRPMSEGAPTVTTAQTLGMEIANAQEELPPARPEPAGHRQVPDRQPAQWQPTPTSRIPAATRCQATNSINSQVKGVEDSNSHCPNSSHRVAHN